MVKLSIVMESVRQEVLKAQAQHASMHSSHEGYAVILEELDELWDEVKANRGVEEAGMKEAVQVAAMACRYILDLTPEWRDV